MAPSISTFSDKVECKVPARRMWRASYELAPQYLPKALPHIIQSVHYTSPLAHGCIGTVFFHKADAAESEAPALIKERFEDVDNDAFKLTAVVTEGGVLGTLFKSYLYRLHIKEAGPESCVVHYTFEYEPIHDQHKHEFPQEVKGIMIETFKQVEAYLLTHSDCL